MPTLHEQREAVLFERLPIAVREQVRESLERHANRLGPLSSWNCQEVRNLLTLLIDSSWVNDSEAKRIGALIDGMTYNCQRLQAGKSTSERALAKQQQQQQQDNNES